jgi:hypothetical protein
LYFSVFAKKNCLGRIGVRFLGKKKWIEPDETLFNEDRIERYWEQMGRAKLELRKEDDFWKEISKVDAKKRQFKKV